MTLADILTAAIADGSLTSVQMRVADVDDIRRRLVEFQAIGMRGYGIDRHEADGRKWWQGCAYGERVSVLVATASESVAP